MGAFVIFNTLSITVAQRAREFATLRTLGASRRQVLRSVILESLALGLAASLLGLGLGVALAKGLSSLLQALGMSLPQTALVFAPRTAVVALVAGTTVTLLAGLVPAFKATRVPPIAAVREGAIRRRLRSCAASSSGLALGILGALLLVKVAVANGGVVSIVAGALLLFVGMAAIATRLVPGARERRRPAGEGRGRVRRAAGEPQRGPQPGPHRLDRGRADDRARARHLRRRARPRCRRLGQERRREADHRRLRRPVRERLVDLPQGRRAGVAKLGATVSGVRYDRGRVGKSAST